MAQKSSGPITDWHPDLMYDFKLNIGDTDYSANLIQVDIRSTISTPYQHIFLDVYMDPQDILNYEIFGQQDIKLIIKMIGKEPGHFANDIIFELAYLDTETEYRPREQVSETDQKEQTIIRFKTVCINSYKTMSTMVNKIYFNKTPFDIISDLIKTTDAELKYDEQGRNTQIIDQLLIPPTTVYNVINYLDMIYGIFEGPLSFHTSYDNKLMIQNLNKKVNESQMFTLFLLATDSDNKEALEPTDPSKTFYTRTVTGSSYKGNAVYSVQSPKIKYIVKPRNELSRTIDVNLENFTFNNGIIEKNHPRIYYNKKAMNKRLVYDTRYTGYDDKEAFIKSNLSQNIIDMAMTTSDVEGNLPILNLMSVGNHIKIKTKVKDQIKIGGAYILKGSDIHFRKETTWAASARLYMIRSNIASQ